LIVALKNAGNVYVAYDSSEVDIIGISANDLENLDNHFIWRVMDTSHTLVVSALSLTASDLIRYLPMIREPLTIRSIQMDSVSNIYQTLKKFHQIDDEGRLPGELLIVDDHQIFSIHPYRTVNEHQENCAIGYHTLLVDEVLNQTLELPIVDRIRRVYDSLNSYTHRNWYPVTLVDISTMQKQILKA
jgi:hypothetical protein